MQENSGKVKLIFISKKPWGAPGRDPPATGEEEVRQQLPPCSYTCRKEWRGGGRERHTSPLEKRSIYPFSVPAIRFLLVKRFTFLEQQSHSITKIQNQVHSWVGNRKLYSASVAALWRERKTSGSWRSRYGTGTGIRTLVIAKWAQETTRFWRKLKLPSRPTSILRTFCRGVLESFLTFCSNALQ